MITIELEENEVQSLVGLLDAGLKTIGFRAAKDAAMIAVKLEEAIAVEEAIAAQTKKSEKKKKK